jgi:signal transduction histidine kinase
MSAQGMLLAVKACQGMTGGGAVLPADQGSQNLSSTRSMHIGVAMDPINCPKTVIITSCMQRIFLICFLLIVFFRPCAHAAGPVPKLAYFHDETASTDIEDIHQKGFKPFDRSLRLGFAQGDTWIRVSSAPLDAGERTTGPDSQKVLRVGPHYLDRVWMHQWDGQRWVIEKAGDLTRKNAAVCQDDLFCFFPSQSPNPSFTVYFKINTDGLRWIQLEVLDQKELQNKVIDRVVRISVALALASGLLFLGVLFLWVDSSRLMQAYCIFQLTSVVFTFSNTGVMAKVFTQMEPDVLNTLGQASQLLRVCMTVLLGWSVLMQYKNSPIYLGLVRALLLAAVVSLAMLWVWSAQYALQLSFLIFVVNPLVQLWGVTHAQGIERKTQRILIMGYAFYAVILSYGSMVAFGWWPQLDSEATLSTVSDWRLNGGLVSLFVFWVVIRQHQFSKFKQLEAIQSLSLVRMKAENQSQQLKERQSLIDMLTHELKNPLSTIRFSLESIKRSRITGEASDASVQHIAHSVDRMDTLIEHVAHSNQVETGLMDVIENLNMTQIVLESIMEYASPDKFNFIHGPDTSLCANRQLVSIVVENLLGNAYKYASEGRVDVSLAQVASAPNMSGAAVVLTVSNHVAAENLPDPDQMFTRYYRHPNVMGISGMGIGLSLVKSAVERMGGDVDVDIHDPSVTFCVRIPVQLTRKSDS